MLGCIQKRNGPNITRRGHEHLDFQSFFHSCFHLPKATITDSTNKIELFRQICTIRKTFIKLLPDLILVMMNLGTSVGKFGKIKLLNIFTLTDVERNLEDKFVFTTGIKKNSLDCKTATSPLRNSIHIL